MRITGINNFQQRKYDSKTPNFKALQVRLSSEGITRQFYTLLRTQEPGLFHLGFNPIDGISGLVRTEAGSLQEVLVKGSLKEHGFEVEPVADRLAGSWASNLRRLVPAFDSGN